MRGALAGRALDPSRALGVAVVSLVLLALVDVGAGPDTVLAPLMVVAPCAVALVGGRREVVVTGSVALLLLVLLSWPDRLWGTAAQVYYLLAILAATALTALAAGRGRSTEAALRGAHSGERRLAAIVASSDDAVIGKQLDGTITDWNAGAQRMYGWTADEAVGRNISLIVPPDRRRELQSVLDRVAAGERVAPFDTRRVHRDGHLLDVSLAISPLRDADGELVGASAVARDVTRLAETQARVAALVESAIDCIVLIDQDDRVLEFNPAAQETFGWTREEAVGARLHDLIIPAEDRDAHIRGMERFLRTGIGPILGRSRPLTAQR